MDQKRFFIWIAVSIGILLAFEYFGKRVAPIPPPVHPESGMTAPAQPGVRPGGVPAGEPVVVDTGTGVPRLRIDADAVSGSIDLRGALFDDLVLKDYRETLARNSPDVLLFAPSGAPQPYFVQYGWTAAPGTAVKVPDEKTVWTASAPVLTTAQPVTLSWDNGAGLTYQIVLGIDRHYMFSVQQRVVNRTAAPVALYPWSRIRRLSPKNPVGAYSLYGQTRTEQKLASGSYVLFEGLLGVLDGTLHEVGYSSAAKDGARNGGLDSQLSSSGGWIGMTDKYWLSALIPDQNAPFTASFRGDAQDDTDSYQIDVTANAPMTAPANGAVDRISHLFAGAKVVDLLQQYQRQYDIPAFWKAVDFGIFFFLTRPFFACINWLFHLTGNFGIAIMIFTVLIKAVFFPLANKSYRSMGKMRDLQPKMQALRERYRDEPAKLQGEMLGLYKKEGVNPASGCLPMLIQVPVFFSLYKVIYVTIAMRQAPFFGWIRDLSAPDPTNVFNLFGLLPFDPGAIAPTLHLGVWPLFMGITMYVQQRLNPPPPDPVQARMFQFMPLIFTFMMGRFPAGLVIYWSWNNLLTAAQQWFIMRSVRKSAPAKPA
jgi:YidC/Oxa1 family membrane protein insertase